METCKKNILRFAEVPEHRPFIVGIRPRYRVGDSLRGNCTSKHSKPAANLTWIVNDLPVRIFFLELRSVNFCNKMHQTTRLCQTKGILYLLFVL